MTDKTYFATLAAYNRWANGKLYAAAEALGDAARRADRQGFFGSIHNTLNHIMVGDRLWLSRFPGQPAYRYRLDEVPYPDFDALKAAREAQDQVFIDFLAAMTPEYLAGDLSYTNTRGETFTMPVRLVLGHVFNHQTHHRGQVHHMIGMAGMGAEAEPPAIDLIYYLREVGV